MEALRPLLSKLGTMQGVVEEEQDEKFESGVVVWWCGEKADQVGPAWPSPPAKGSLVCLLQGQDP